MILEAWERLRARRNPGTAMAASKAMIATTIMISTRVKPARLVVSFLSILGVSLSILCSARCEGRDFFVAFSQLIPCHQRADDRRMNRQILSYRVTRTSRP